MGHCVLRCDFCDNDVMEGRNNWKCSCGAECIPGKTNGWEMPKKPAKQENKVLDKLLEFLIKL